MTGASREWHYDKDAYFQGHITRVHKLYTSYNVEVNYTATDSIHVMLNIALKHNLLSLNNRELPHWYILGLHSLSVHDTVAIALAH